LISGLHRSHTADHIAYDVVYLASDESRFVTGSELVIDADNVVISSDLTCHRIFIRQQSESLAGTPEIDRR